MKKNKIITSVVVMALCSFAIAYATNKSGIIVFILSWIVGMLASLLIQYIWSSKLVPAKFLVLHFFLGDFNKRTNLHRSATA